MEKEIWNARRQHLSTVRSWGWIQRQVQTTGVNLSIIQNFVGICGSSSLDGGWWMLSAAELILVVEE